MRVREYYGYAIIAGIRYEDARRMTPGWIMDMYIIRCRHDARMMGGRRRRR